MTEDAKATLAGGTISDWRIADDVAEELTTQQREPWNFTLKEGGYGGLIVDLVSPDGSTRSVTLEIDNGNLKVMTFGLADEAHAIIQVGKDETVVEAMTPARGLHAQGVRFGAKGLVLGNNELDPGCTDDVVAPTL